MTRPGFPIRDSRTAKPPCGTRPDDRAAVSEPLPSGSPLSLYLHVPFCRCLCPFCHFYRVPEVPDWRLYLAAVRRELQGLDLDAPSLRTLFVGGGNPTLLPADFFRGFKAFLADRLDLSRMQEVTIETDGAVSERDMACLVEAGFNRLSIGIKTFQPRCRRILRIGGRVVGDPVRAARRAGFSFVNLDMIYGFAGQRAEDFLEDLDRILSTGPDHVSLYPLENGRGRGPREGDPDASAAFYRESSRVLRLGGYDHYEIANFAKPGCRSLHNLAYWTDGDYLGVGPSAHSSLTRNGVRRRSRNRPGVAAYLRDPAACREEVVWSGGRERASEALILRLRLSEGVPMPCFIRRYGVDPLELLRPGLKQLDAAGLVRFSSGNLRLTMRGALLSNEVFAMLV